MAISVSLVEQDVAVAPSEERVSVSVTEPTVSVAVVDERVDISVIEQQVQVYPTNDKIDVAVIERPVQIIIAESNSEQVVQEEELYDIEIDTSVANITYVGQALPGTPSSALAWRIKRITETSGGSSVDWANGAAEFVHSWDSHLSLTYGP